MNKKLVKHIDNSGIITSLQCFKCSADIPSTARILAQWSETKISHQLIACRLGQFELTRSVQLTRHRWLARERSLSETAGPVGSTSGSSLIWQKCSFRLRMRTVFVRLAMRILAAMCWLWPCTRVTCVFADWRGSSANVASKQHTSLGKVTSTNNKWWWVGLVTRERV